MIRFSHLLSTPVVTQDGKVLGHLIDLRCGEAGGRDIVRVTELVYGTIGVLNRIGIKAVAEKRLPWDQVVAVEKDRIVVKFGPYAHTQGRNPA